MKIIKEGKVPNFVGVCKFCGCEFEASYNEVESETQHYPYSGDITSFYCKCPCCGTRMSIKMKD